ncbi:MAG: hypothetical protein ACLQIB_31675 [Isosphaeraceae bacterium]
MGVRIDSAVARYGLPGLVLGMVLAWGGGVRGPQVVAEQTVASERPAGVPRVAPRSGEGGKSQAGRSIAGGDGSGTLALITETAGPAQWLYVIDTKKRAFAVYRIDPSNAKGTVKLEASRQYKWDLELEHYNNQAPEPAAIEATVKTLAHPSQ